MSNYITVRLKKIGIVPTLNSNTLDRSFHVHAMFELQSRDSFYPLPVLAALLGAGEFPRPKSSLYRKDCPTFATGVEEMGGGTEVG